MLAKVLKNRGSDNIFPYMIPEIVESEDTPREPGAFVFPETAKVEISEPEPPDEMFSYEDEAEEAVGLVEKARLEAAEIISKAEQDKEMIEQAAREKGLQFAQNQIDSDVAAQVAEMQNELAETIEKISGLRTQITTGTETEIVELALEIAKKIITREVTIDREIALTLAKVSLSRLNNRAIARVHLHPDDLNFVEIHREKLDFHGSLELVEDRSVSMGGCLIHTETGEIDARIDSQFDEIAHGLLEI